MFAKWLKTKNEPSMELDKLLARFFMVGKKKDGSPYEPTTSKIIPKQHF